MNDASPRSLTLLNKNPISGVVYHLMSHGSPKGPPNNMGYSQLLLVALQVANTLVVEHREAMLN